MKKHKYNIYPEAKTEDYNELVESIRTNGFSKQFPITTYQGEIIDGWHRWKACEELGVTPIIEVFHGSDMDAINFVLLTNRRRNLNSGQRACIAVEATEIIEAISESVEAERRAKISEARTVAESIKREESEPALLPEARETAQKIAPSTTTKTENETRTKTAEIFGTNRTYVNQATKVKTAPEIFAKVKAGNMTMQDANKAVRAIPVDPWLDDEKQRKAQCESGQAVIANQQRDKNLIAWAEKNGHAVRVDRGTLFGNPFMMGADGDRDSVCDAYRDHYLPHKPSIKSKLSSLKGKVLICHCYPERCHAESLLP